MSTPAIIYIILFVIGWFSVLIQNGQPIKKRDKDLGTNLFAYALIFGLYYWGGFFDEIGVIQLALVGTYLLALVISQSMTRYSIGASSLVGGTIVYLLYSGGFFA